MLARHNTTLASLKHATPTFCYEQLLRPIAMAPIDRREHRQQRVRGAGPSSVQASFGFNFGALGARPAKQASLPPQPSTRRTPVRTTPRGANGSAQRHRSASVQRSGSAKPRGSPRDSTVTPHLGKRKRGAAKADPNQDDGEADELSPEHAEPVRSIEKSRRVAATVSPIREEVDEEPDELSILEDGGSTVRKSATPKSAAANGTPVSVLVQKRTTTEVGSARSPLASLKSISRRISRRSSSKSMEPVLTTPSMLPAGQPHPSSTSRVTPALNTSGAVQAVDDSEDELSPEHADGATLSVVASEQGVDATQTVSDEIEADELSSPVQPTPSARNTNGANGPRDVRLAKSTPTTHKAKGGRRRTVVLDEDEDASSTLPANRTSKPSRPTRGVPGKAAATPATIKRQTKTADTSRQAEDQLDELSPDKDRNVAAQRQTLKRPRDVVILSDGEESDEYEEPEEEEDPVPTPPRSRSTTKRASPKRTQNIRQSSEKPPRKRHRFLGPKQAISVMRIKGSTVRGITVADTTRTILEETINHRLGRLNEAAQASQDPARRKELRGELNMSLSFKESLNEKLLDLQDANDILSTNFKKMKLFKRDNAELRKDILAHQNNRQEVAIEHDDVQAEHDAEKAGVDARNKLSEDMFSIEAAVQAGREKARREGREDEGPHVPISMLIGMVGRDVGSAGGGLLGNIKMFNTALEKAAGWLEGRA
ncbi:hypothetical protein DE146DRAFT_715048 [Phaeosphaeria sp. MPI-PUGE-AT-0046c]|nr:hypothetical protein DE146DRAFT_715048 [Phaeosphaeria sp. MPI-PUGE-AT-0046c]